MLLATVQVVEDDERRSFDRKSIERVTTLRGANARPTDIIVRDFSADGFRFTSSKRFAIGNIVRVGLAGAGISDARIVRRAGDDYGCSFLTPLTPQRMAEAFSSANVVDMHSAAATEGFPEPAIDKWPGSVRMAILVIAPVLLWGMVAGIAVAFHR